MVNILYRELNLYEDFSFYLVNCLFLVVENKSDFIIFIVLSLIEVIKIAEKKLWKNFVHFL